MAFNILGGNFASATNTDSAWHGGVQAGYNWQSGCTVFGVQVDWSWTDSEADSFHTTGGVGRLTHRHTTLNSQLRWFGTARTRTGIVVDNLLLYVTGGLAFARFERERANIRSDRSSRCLGGLRGPNRNRLGLPSSASARSGPSPPTGASSARSSIWASRRTSRPSPARGPRLPCGGLTGSAFRYEFQDNVGWATRIGVNYRFGGAPY